MHCLHNLQFYIYVLFFVLKENILANSGMLNCNFKRNKYYAFQTSANKWSTNNSTDGITTTFSHRKTDRPPHYSTEASSRGLK